MKILPTWLREFVDIPVDDHRLAENLTNAGTAVEGIDEVQGQTVYEVEFTANRVDTMNHYGVARECAAIYDRELKALASLMAATHPAEPGRPRPGTTDISIQIDAPDLCARYTGQIVRNVVVKASPESISGRLALLESRSINNVTDASNYTLLEMGHPTHCFDLDKLADGKIIVRRARPGEKLKTLDGAEHLLHPDDLVIADASQAVALAGVMGGWDTMITNETRTVLIEAAWFDPASVRKTARRHGLHTDASHRFERGADIGATTTACALVTQRLAEWAGGQITGAQIDVYPRKLQRTPVRVRRQQIARVLGDAVPEHDVQRILQHLGFRVTAERITAVSVAQPASAAMPAGAGGTHAAVVEEPAGFAVEIPSWRLDVAREIDLVEEVARLYGYNRFPATLPSFAGAVEDLPDAARERKLRSMLLALGYSEAVSLAFIARQDASQFSASLPVELANPVSEDAPMLRNSMLPGMLGMLAWNLNRGNSDVRLFERGHIFEQTGERVSESRRLCLGAAGAARPETVQESGRAYSFFDLKGAVEQLLAPFQSRDLLFEDFPGSYFQPGCSARALLDGIAVAQLGQLHPQLAESRKLRQDVYLAEVDLERLYRNPLRQPKYRPISRFPAIERDFSFVFGQAVRWERIRSAIEALRLSELQSLRPIEIFRGGQLAAGEYSLLLRATFQSPERTLRDEEVGIWSAQITQALEALGGKLRA